ncbi:MAG: hypothetical protein E6I81_05475 [Chloroflexi bacterium]|nr:MAG: hypothetical protein AUI15_37265 [Actinobacteria bacterium 13_2_20CM_2_66_6]TMD37008.1 MAG: hypothetical protein E6I89_09875 [Chloroflexota bacterium]TMD73158.1 MAG: hypothetical protein E6I81_05475 [Chloroflexota bacterium]
MINRSDRVQIWASQLWANDFPPVCAMTGRPAETWRKFKFSTPPDWAYALLALVCLGGLGVIAFAVVMALVAQRATGFLPLTKASSTTVTLCTWIPSGLLIGGFGLWLLALVIALSTSDSTASAVAGWSFFLGLLFIIAGLIGRLVVKPLICPRAKVKEAAPGQNDRIVELRNVNAAFVMAVRQSQQARAAQFAQATRPNLLQQ